MKYRVFFLSGMKWWLVGVINHEGRDHLILTCLRAYARQYTKRQTAERDRDRLRRLGYSAHIQAFDNGGDAV